MKKIHRENGQKAHSIIQWHIVWMDYRCDWCRLVEIQEVKKKSATTAKKAAAALMIN